MTRRFGVRFPFFGKNFHVNYNPRLTRAVSHVLFAFSLSTGLLLATAFSQSYPPTMADDQAGEQAYMSYHGGDIDSVGLTNGTLSLNFPFLSYPQRGKLHLSFNLIYHNGPQHQGQFCVTANGKQICNWLTELLAAPWE